MKRLAFLAIFILVATACKEVFDIPPQSRVKANLFDSSTKQAISPVVTIKPIGLNNLFYDKEGTSSLILPLSPDNLTSFQVTFDSYIDTITFQYKADVQYDSMESGFYYEYTLKQVNTTKFRITSIQITDSLVTKTLHENIKIYIRPLPSGGS